MILVIVFLTLSNNRDEFLKLFAHLGGRVVYEEHINEGGLVGLL